METSSELFLSYVQPHWRRLHVVARQYVSGDNHSLDLVQETLLRAWRGFSPSEEKTYRRAWLFVIMRHIVWEWHRTASRRVLLTVVPDAELTEVASPAQTEPFAPLPTMDEERFREFLDDRIVVALDQLEPSFREVIILSAAGELNYREIADVLGCPMGTVMSRMARARRALREQLAGYAISRGWLKEGRP